MEAKERVRLPSLSLVRKTLKADWALRVKKRDGWCCLLCKSVDRPTAHHWYVTSQRAHAARFAVDNGATLCFTCHIREVHENPGFATIKKIYDAVVARTPNFSEGYIDELMKQEVDTAVLRSLWDQMRANPIVGWGNPKLIRKGTKLFLTDEYPRQWAVPGNTLLVPDLPGLYEVMVVTPTDDGIRYTIREVKR